MRVSALIREAVIGEKDLTPGNMQVYRNLPGKAAHDTSIAYYKVMVPFVERVKGVMDEYLAVIDKIPLDKEALNEAKAQVEEAQRKLEKTLIYWCDTTVDNVGKKLYAQIRRVAK